MSPNTTTTINTDDDGGDGADDIKLYLPGA